LNAFESTVPIPLANYTKLAFKFFFIPPTLSFLSRKVICFSAGQKSLQFKRQVPAKKAIQRLLEITEICLVVLHTSLI